MKKTILPISLLCLTAISAYLIFGKNQHASAQPNDNAQAMPVQAMTVQEEAIRIWKSFSGRLEAVEFAQIRPQVSGAITDIMFDDGQRVEKDQILYVIDPRTYQAAVNQAKADLKITKNESALAWKKLKRAKELIKTSAISQGVYDERSSGFQVAKSKIEAAEANLETAKINLDYAYVKAPISGLTGRAEIKVGNLVQSGANAPVLTSIVSDQGIYADFEVDDQTYLKFVRKTKSDSKDLIPVRMTLAGNDRVYKGVIHSFDNQINAASGTIRARAYFENNDSTLLPGMFASIEISTPDTSKQIMIPARAIGTDQDRKFVYVINDKGLSEYRKIDIGASVDGKRVVTSGLKGGDQIISEGIIRIRPGMPVNPNAKPEPEPEQTTPEDIQK